MTAFRYGELDSKAFKKLSPCPGCAPMPRKDKIDELNEAECDELAWELDIDWYESTGMSLEEKRATIKIAQQVKRKRGTKWAVERLISIYFGEGYVMEWFDTNGDPYTFVALTTSTHITPENYAKFVEAVKIAKNARSRIGGVFYLWKHGPDPGIEFALGSKLYQYKLEKCKHTLGFAVKAGSIETEPEVTPYKYFIEKCCEKKPKKCDTLRDLITGQLYYLYVSAGRLIMDTTTKTTARNNFVFDDRATGKKYSVYVSAGRLTMDTTDENVTGNDLVFDDHTTSQKYNVFVSTGKLTMDVI